LWWFHQPSFLLTRTKRKIIIIEKHLIPSPAIFRFDDDRRIVDSRHCASCLLSTNHI
jgi:hypothetical protein